MYSDDNYFSYKYDILGKQYFHMEDSVEDIKDNLQRMQKYILNVQNKNQELYFTKLFVEFRWSTMEAVKHVILLILYKNQWFVLDTNGGDADYVVGKNFAKALSELGIRWCGNNDTFLQEGNTCDTCASLMSYFFSVYYAKNKKLPLIAKGKNIDFKKIEAFLQQENLDGLFDNFFIRSRLRSR